MPSDEPALWDFALELYRAKQVSDSCIALQDESSVDVLVLLFALWLARNSVALTEADLQQADSRVAEWRDQVSRPLRDVRRFLKPQRPASFSDEAEGFRHQVKAVELESERLALKVLETEGLQLIGSRERAVNTAQANADAVVRFYRRTEFDTACRAALDKILEVFMHRTSDGFPE